MSIQAYSPLEQGLLTGKVTMDTTYPEGSTRNTNPCFQPARRMQAIRLLAEGYSNREIGELFGVPANYVTAWVAKARKVLKRQRDYEYSGALS